MRRKRAGLTSVAVVALSVATLLPQVPAHAHSGEYLLVWAGDWNKGDTTSADVSERYAAASDLLESGRPGPDFLAVIDADAGSPTYGKVMRTVTVPGVENEPHHMQYSWRQGERVFAGGLFGDNTFIFDVEHAPDVELVSTVDPLDTPCGSVPDAYWVLSDGSALGTYMGGPNVANDPRCNAGDSNGFAGTPGEVVHISPNGDVLGEFSAAGDPAHPFAADIRPNRCASVTPLRQPSCANPHGIQAREDLGVMITSDYAEPRNVPIAPANAPDNRVFRDTVRIWNIEDLDNISLRSVSVMPRTGSNASPPERVDPRGVMGIMETTVTNLPGHRGAFASSMCGGAIFYTADITETEPYWTQVLDVSAAARRINPMAPRADGCAGAGWLQTSPDDSVLFQAVIGRNAGTLDTLDAGIPKMVYAIDIRSLLAVHPSDWVEGSASVCSIDTAEEVLDGGNEESCPTVRGARALTDETTGGPHWGTIDPFTMSSTPGRLTTVTRVASSNYFVARSGLDGNHKVCMLDVGADGGIGLDTTFRDEVTNQPCIDFDRTLWPHGAYGRAKPHALLFIKTP